MTPGGCETGEIAGDCVVVIAMKVGEMTTKLSKK